jgi:hypothetical protein
MMSLDAWTIIALILAGLGAVVLVALRWRPEFAEHARALLVAAVAVYLSGVAARTGHGVAIWFSGFFVCAAVHRWIEAVSQNMRTKGAEQ